ncbi:MAG: hypothetical protein FVQ77_12155 [Cytophagales bacterium]|nr:hypothetical protein [Cytophagales bacterium]
MEIKQKLTNQIVGNIGLYYICYELSKKGWNVLPTSRNTKGVDIVIFNHDASTKHTIQVKTLSKITPLPLGTNINNLFADFLIVCVLEENPPKLYILKMHEIKESDEIKNQLDKASKKGLWALNSKRAWDNFTEKYLNNWEIIGNGYSN